MKIKRIKSEFKNNNVVITLPIDILINAAEMREDGYAMRVTNKKLFGKEIARRVVEEVDSQEDGSTMFFRLLDRLFIDIYEDGSKCVELIDEDEDDDS